MPTRRLSEAMDFSKQGHDKKASKPLMEKRRRARINHSLAQLKSLVIDPNTTERSRQAKLEKADILELTVRHLHEIKGRQRTIASLTSGNPKKKFELGYSECVREVELFLTNLMDPKLVGIDPDLQRRLKEHLSRRLTDFHEPHPQNTSNPSEPSSADTSSPAVKPDSTANSPSPPPLSPCGVVESYTTLYPDTKLTQSSDSNGALSPIYSANGRFGSPPAQIVPHSCMPSPSSSESNESEGFACNQWIPKPPSPLSEYPQSRDLSSKTKTGFVGQQQFSKPPIRVEDAYGRITLAPRRLPNGDWALVLPGNMSLSEIERQSPSSAFRLVWPSSSGVGEVDKTRHAVSPLSSSVSDMSCEDYGLQEAEVKVEPDLRVNEDPQSVWRPW